MGEQGVVRRVLARQGAAVRLGEARPPLAAAGLERDHGHVPLGGLFERRHEGRRIAHRLQEQADCAGGLVGERELHVVRDGRDHLVPGRHDVVERHTAAVLQEALPDGAAVRDQRDVAGGRLGIGLVAGDREALAGGHEPHAVGTADHHLVGVRDLGEPTLQRGLLRRIRPRAGEHDGGRDPTGRGLLECLHQARVGNGQQRAVGPLGQIAQRCVTGAIEERLVAGVHAEDAAGIAEALQVREELAAEALRLADPDDRQRARLQQRCQVSSAHHILHPVRSRDGALL